MRVNHDIGSGPLQDVGSEGAASSRGSSNIPGSPNQSTSRNTTPQQPTITSSGNTQPGGQPSSAALAGAAATVADARGSQATPPTTEDGELSQNPNSTPLTSESGTRSQVQEVRNTTQTVSNPEMETESRPRPRIRKPTDLPRVPPAEKFDDRPNSEWSLRQMANAPGRMIIPEAPTYTVFQGAKQPPPAERLEQAKIFLADEDYFRFQPKLFKIFMKQIEEYIDDLENNIWDYDLGAVKHIRAMIEVHKTWIKKETEVPNLDYSFMEDREPWILQLAGFSTNPTALQKKVKDLVDCWKMSIGSLNTGRYDKKGNLPEGVPLCLAVEPAKWMEEPEEMEYTKVMREYRSKKQANYTQVRNELINEHRGDYSYVPPPPHCTGPYIPTTKAMIASKKQDRYDMLTQLFEDLIKAQRAAPRHILRKIILEIETLIHQENAPSLAVVASQLAEAENPESANFRPQLLTQRDLDDLRILTKKSWISKPGALSHEDPNLTPQLHEFHGDLEAVFMNTRWLPLDNERGVDVPSITNQINTMRANRDPDLPGIQLLLTPDEVLNFLPYLVEAEYFRATGTTVNVRINRPILDAHPEQRWVIMDPDRTSLFTVPEIRIDADGTTAKPTFVTGFDFLYLAARRLGREINNVRDWGSTPEDANGEGEQASAIEKVNLRLENPVEYIDLQHLTKIAAPLHQGEEELTEKAAAQLLLMKTLEEQHTMLESRIPDGDRLWGWAKDLPARRVGGSKGKFEFFALDRWPVELQTPERKLQIGSSGPAALPKKRKRNFEDPEAYWAEAGMDFFPEESRGREMHFSGESLFPFGETPFQKAYQSYQIEKGLEKVPEFKELYTPAAKKAAKRARAIDMFALPEVPEKKRPVFMKPKPTQRRVITQEEVDQTAIDLHVLANESQQIAQRIQEASRKRGAADQATGPKPKRPRTARLEPDK